MTGMGEIVPVGDHVALAKAIIHILDKDESYHCYPEIIAKTFSPEQTASEYLHLYDNLLAGKQGGSIEEPAGYGLLRQMRDSA
jgi:glycosyltransferase involved in cell wall biosynthesis